MWDIVEVCLVRGMMDLLLMSTCWIMFMAHLPCWTLRLASDWHRYFAEHAVAASWPDAVFATRRVQCRPLAVTRTGTQYQFQIDKRWLILVARGFPKKRSHKLLSKWTRLDSFPRKLLELYCIVNQLYHCFHCILPGIIIIIILIIIIITITDLSSHRFSTSNQLYTSSFHMGSYCS